MLEDKEIDEAVNQTQQEYLKLFKLMNVAIMSERDLNETQLRRLKENLSKGESAMGDALRKYLEEVRDIITNKEKS